MYALDDRIVTESEEKETEKTGEITDARDLVAVGGTEVGAPATLAQLWAKARCNDSNGTLTPLFFSEDPIDIARAKAICSRCSIRATCLSAALDSAEPWGVWGGELIVNGGIVTNKRRRGRPPKTPRPELVVEEVPLPSWAARTA